jgi:hypothetical protein
MKKRILATLFLGLFSTTTFSQTGPAFTGNYEVEFTLTSIKKVQFLNRAMVVQGVAFKASC